MTSSTERYEAFKSHFSGSLHKLCQERGSVNKICDEIGINRQQFAKYLSGSTLPSAYIIQRMVEYFNIDPSLFFITHEKRHIVHSEQQVEASELDLKTGYYLEYSTCDGEGGGLTVSAWRFYECLGRMICHGELPIPGKAGSFIRVLGKITLSGKELMLKATGVPSFGDTDLQVTMFFRPYVHGLSDLLAFQVYTCSNTSMPVRGQVSLFRYINKSPDIVDLLTNKCRVFERDAQDEQLRGISRILASHTEATDSHLFLKL